MASSPRRLTISPLFAGPARQTHIPVCQTARAVINSAITYMLLSNIIAYSAEFTCGEGSFIHPMVCIYISQTQTGGYFLLMQLYESTGIFYIKQDTSNYYSFGSWFNTTSDNHIHERIKIFNIKKYINIARKL